jgi:hypothetical protein
MTAAAGESMLCRLEQAVGVEAACRGVRCPFWEPGGAVLEGRCRFESIDFSRERDIARLLIGIRDRLEGRASRE